MIFGELQVGQLYQKMAKKANKMLKIEFDVTFNKEILWVLRMRYRLEKLNGGIRYGGTHLQVVS